MANSSVQKRVFALLREAQVVERPHRMGLASWILYREVTTFSDLSEFEYQLIADMLSDWQKRGVLVEESRAHGAV